MEIKVVQIGYYYTLSSQKKKKKKKEFHSISPQYLVEMTVLKYDQVTPSVHQLGLELSQLVGYLSGSAVVLGALLDSFL